MTTTETNSTLSSFALQLMKRNAEKKKIYSANWINSSLPKASTLNRLTFSSGNELCYDIRIVNLFEFFGLRLVGVLFLQGLNSFFQ